MRPDKLYDNAVCCGEHLAKGVNMWAAYLAVSGQTTRQIIQRVICNRIHSATCSPVGLRMRTSG